MIFVLLFILSIIIVFFITRRNTIKAGDSKAYLALELGSLQIYSYQTLKEFKAQNTVWWRDFKAAPNIEYGPFLSINEAMKHYSAFISNKPPTPPNVIEMDFKNKKRIK